MSNSVQSVGCSKLQPVGYYCSRENGHDGPCACVPFPAAPQMPVSNAAPRAILPDSIFDKLGGNWRWASLDYRGVARVHTFQPTFTDSGRIELPIGKGNSDICEAHSIVDLPPNWKPMWVFRLTNPVGYPVTDRFGKALPAGADPIEAADVVNVVDVVVDAGPKYSIGTAVDFKSFITQKWESGSVVAGFDGPTYILRRGEDYAGFKVDELRVTVTEKERFHAKVCEVLGWGAESESTTGKLFDAGCRFQ